jgi:hypothetical protein
MTHGLEEAVLHHTCGHFCIIFFFFSICKGNLRGRLHSRDMTFHYCDFSSDRVFLINKANTPFIFIIISSHICGRETLKISLFFSLGLLMSCTALEKDLLWMCFLYWIMYLSK